MSKFYPPSTTSAIRLANTPAKGEILFDTDLNKLFIGDGITVGGIEIGSGGGGGGGGSTGDMLKSVYDTDNNGIVDEAEAISGSTSANQYYGTNANNIKGFYNLPSGEGGGTTEFDRALVQAMITAGVTI